ncbi:hypothetical protein [Actinomycetospora aeridis]|uniref:Translation initiation factor IF-2 n=1 Tax=Actinomycetospora aeridis TaxID=3129231 RepID=A0ABU8N9X2_9PSEU
MDDERLLSEALRAHAAGGVSSPGTPNAPQPSPGGAQASPVPPAAPEGAADAGGSRLRDRFRPLGRKRGADAAPETVVHPTAGPVGTPPGAPFPTTTTRGGQPPARPAPRPGPATDRPWPQTGPRSAGRPTHQGPPPGYPPGPGVPHPRTAPGHVNGVTGATGAGPAAPPLADREPADPGAWTPARIAWWSGMALLAGAVAGALAAVGTLGLPG